MATLQVTKQYSITTDTGDALALDAGTTVESVGEVIKRDVKIPTSEATVLLIGAAVAAGQMTDIKFCVIHNTDQVNFIRLRLEDTAGHTADFKVLAGQSFDIYNTKVSVSETGAAFASFSDIDTVSAQADTGDVVITMFSGESC
jgi:hypothetical protein